MEGACEHVKNANDSVKARSEGCEECIREGTHWVALRRCLACGHIGCCDSSAGRHATNHFRKTNHPVMAEFPDCGWKWCYLDKAYG